MCCGPSSPPPYQQAQQQTGINREAIFDSARVNQINQTTPFGSRYYTGQIGGPDRQENVELSPELQNILTGQLGVTQGMTDASQGALSRLTSAPFNLTQGATGVRQAGPQSFRTSFDRGPGLVSGIEDGGALTRGVQAGPLQNNVQSQFGIQNTFGDAGPLQRQVADVGGPQRSVDLAGLTQIPGSSDFGGERARVEDALYGRQRRFIDPDLTEQRDSLETKLANQGFTPGTEGYQKAVESFERSREMTLGNARDSAIAQAGGEQGRLFGQGLQARQQEVAERFGTGEFGNSAQAQAYGQALGSGQFSNQSQQQQFSQNLERALFGNQAQAQDFGQRFQNAQMFNSAQGQEFGQGMENAGLNNQASMLDYERNLGRAGLFNESTMSDFGRNLAGAEFANAGLGMQGQYDMNLQASDQALRGMQTGENLTQRNQGFNELAALLSSSPVQPSNPGYTNFDPRAQYQMAQASPDVMGGYAQQNQARAAIMGSIFGGLGKLGGAAIGKWG